MRTLPHVHIFQNAYKSYRVSFLYVLFFFVGQQHIQFVQYKNQNVCVCENILIINIII